MNRVAAIQMSSSSDVQSNLTRMKTLLHEAASQGAALVAFPEMAYFMGSPEHGLSLVPRFEELCALFASWAKEFGVHLAPGSLREPVREDRGKYYNTSLLFDTKGRCTARYRKVFLFRANLVDRSYDEPSYCEAGSEIVAGEWHNHKVGLSICFDLRFPELFRALRKRECRLILIPSAFTVPTGKAHWQALVRARAIENQCFVVAPAQAGHVGDGSEKYGHSLIVSPWGEILAEAERPEQILIADCPWDQLSDAQKQLDAWSCRRDSLFPIP